MSSTSSSVTASTRWSVSGEPNRSSTVACAPSPSDTSVCGNEARPSPSHQCRTRIGSSTTTPAGTCTKAPPARNASCRTVYASSERPDACPIKVETRSSSQVAMPQARTPFASSAGSSSWCTTAAVAHDDHPRVLARLRGPRAAAGRAFVAGCAELVGPERAGTARGRVDRSASSARSPRTASATRCRSSRSDGLQAPPNQPLRSAKRAPRRRMSRPRRYDLRGRERSEAQRARSRSEAQPTAPSMFSSMSRDNSTAYSIGSVFVIGSMNPFTIIAVACCSLSPRLCR